MSLNSSHNPKFDAFFSKVYGHRWAGLYQAMQQPVKSVLRVNAFKTFQVEDFLLNQKVEFLPQAYWCPPDYKTNHQDEILSFYKMDPASCLVAQALLIEEPSDKKVLDLCAAPGGKSLILAEKLIHGGELISNEFSKGRRERLLRVFQEYIPKEQRQHCHVKGLDGNQYGLKHPDTFDAVLADVPCSGERHLLENQSEFEMWTEKRSVHLAVRQFSLLSSAWLALKEGGDLVYSTCSISPYENDDVIKKLIKRRSVNLRAMPDYEKLDFVEKTEYGYHILPDKCGFGPMYFAPMIKT